MSTTFLPFGITTGGVGTATVIVTATFNLTGSTLGNALDYQFYNQNSPCDVQLMNLDSGANLINTNSCPALPTAGGVWLIPPTGNATSVSLKGISADTGIALSLTIPTFIPFQVTPPASFVLTAAGAITGYKLAFV